MGPLGLPASEIPQIFTEHLLYTRGGDYSSGVPLCASGHKHYSFLHPLPPILHKPRVADPAPASFEGA